MNLRWHKIPTVTWNEKSYQKSSILLWNKVELWLEILVLKMQYDEKLKSTFETFKTHFWRGLHVIVLVQTKLCDAHGGGGSSIAKVPGDVPPARVCFFKPSSLAKGILFGNKETQFFFNFWLMQKFGKFCLENANSWHFDVEISLAKGIIFRKIGLANGAILKPWAAHPCLKFSQEPPPPPPPWWCPGNL